MPVLKEVGGVRFGGVRGSFRFVCPWVFLWLLSHLCGASRLGAEPRFSHVDPEADDVIAPDLDSRMFAKLDEGQKLLIAEYHGNFIKLLKFYRSIQMEVVEKRLRLSDGIGKADGSQLPLLKQVRFRYLAMPQGFHRLEEEDSATPNSAPTLRIGIITPAESFLIGRTPPTSPPFLIAHGKDRQEYLGWLSGNYFVTAPFGLGATRLDWPVFANVEGSGMAVESVEVGSIGGEEIVTIVVAGSNSQSSATWRIQLLRNRSWAMRESTVEVIDAEMPDKVLVDRQRCDYRDDVQNPPIPIRAIWESSVRRGDPPVEAFFARSEYDYTSVTPGTPDVQVFDARALVNPPPERRPMSWFRYACIALGVGLVGAGAALRYRKRVSREASGVATVDE